LVSAQEREFAPADQNLRLVKFAEIVRGVNAAAGFQPPLARGTLAANHQQGLLQ